MIDTNRSFLNSISNTKLADRLVFYYACDGFWYFWKESLGEEGILKDLNKLSSSYNTREKAVKACASWLGRSVKKGSKLK